MKPRPPSLRRTIPAEPARGAHRHPSARLHRTESGGVSCQRISRGPPILSIFSDRFAVGPVPCSVSPRAACRVKRHSCADKPPCRCQARGAAPARSGLSCRFAWIGAVSTSRRRMLPSGERNSAPPSMRRVTRFSSLAMDGRGRSSPRSTCWWQPKLTVDIAARSGSASAISASSSSGESGVCLRCSRAGARPDRTRRYISAPDHPSDGRMPSSERPRA